MALEPDFVYDRRCSEGNRKQQDPESEHGVDKPLHDMSSSTKTPAGWGRSLMSDAPFMLRYRSMSEPCLPFDTSGRTMDGFIRDGNGKQLMASL
jgi:hypothetical protein